MPKQIIRDVFEELVETGKKTGQKLQNLPGEIVEEAAQQTGVKPKSEEEKQKEAEIQRMRKEDEEKKRKDIGFWRKQVEAFEKTALPSSSQARIRVEQKEAGILAAPEQKKEELPPPVAAAKRKGKMGSAEFGKLPSG